MKAFIAPTYGPPNTQRIAEVRVPTIGVSDILVQVRATTVNRSDTEMRRASYWFARPIFGLTKPKCEITGSEFAGEVVQVGSKVTRFKPGDHVFGFDGDHYRCHAEYVSKPEDGPIAHMPKGFTFEQCAPLGEGFSYAMCSVMHLEVKPADSVLVNGATGAIGSAAVQIVSSLGAHVVATARAEHFGLVKSFGAKEVIDYETQDFTAMDTRFDLVLDSVGKSTFSQAKKVLKPKGIYHSSELGKKAENVWKVPVTKIVGKRRTVFPIPKINAELMGQAAEMMVDGRFTPHIDRSYSFDEILAASEYVETGQKVGSVVVLIGD